MLCDVVIVAVFALLVVCAVFVGVAGGESENTHAYPVDRQGGEIWENVRVDLALQLG